MAEDQQPTLPPSDQPPQPVCSNLPSGGPYDPQDAQDGTRAAFDKRVKWNKTKLVVAFTNGQNDPWVQIVHQKVREIAPTWSQYADIEFQFVDQTQGDITINFLPNAQAGINVFNCWLGTDCLTHFPSMNLVFPSSLQQNTNFMNSEFQRLILHEFGHSLGLIHEHMRPDRGITWDAQAVIAYYGQLAGWPPWMVQQQILDPAQGDLDLSAAFDEKSIMMYQYPLLSNGQPMARYQDGRPFVTGNNTELAALDKSVIAKWYPKVAPALPEVPLTVGGGETAGSITSAGQVARYRFKTKAAGNYVVETHGQTPVLLALFREANKPETRIAAVEGLGDPPMNPKLTAALAADQTVFVEVRHLLPKTGTGDFKILVHQ